MPEKRSEGEEKAVDPREDAAENLNAWGPGGWSREHGQEHHGSPPEPPQTPAEDWTFDKEAPTG